MKVIVKWSGKRLDLDLNAESPVIEFKKLLSTSTGVPADRQRLLCKGQQIKDDCPWSKYDGITEGAIFMMIGTSSALPSNPPPATQFAEDVDGNQEISLKNVPAGLVNLGNTCYLNSALQVMRQITELADYLQTFSKSPGTISNAAMMQMLGKLFKEMGSAKTITPIAFVATFRAAFPAFAEVRSGQFVQQDAEEAWNQIVQSLHALPKSPVDRLLGFTTVVPGNPNDIVPSLNFTIHVSNSKITTLQGGIAAALESSSSAAAAAVPEDPASTANEAAASSSALETKRQISRLPRYIAVHFCRFYWRHDVNTHVKIRRNLTFPIELDMITHCTPELRVELEKHRDDHSYTPDGRDEFDNKSGLYDLCGVLTHIGSSAVDGHYISWVRSADDDSKVEQRAGTEEPAKIIKKPKAEERVWFKCDDDRVMDVSAAEVLKCSGVSADSHIAYMLLYKEKEL